MIHIVGRLGGYVLLEGEIFNGSHIASSIHYSGALLAPFTLHLLLDGQAIVRVVSELRLC